MRTLQILLAIIGLNFSTLALAQNQIDAMRSCLQVEDQTKERLDCYDDKIKPEPKQVSTPAKAAQDCRFLKEEDERLNCFNRFINLPQNMAKQKTTKPASSTRAPAPSKQ